MFYAEFWHIFFYSNTKLLQCKTGLPVQSGRKALVCHGPVNTQRINGIFKCCLALLLNSTVAVTLLLSVAASLPASQRACCRT